MIDMTKTIVAKSDQLNSDDLIGNSIIIKVTKVALLAGEQPVAIHYEGDNDKPYKPGKSMRRVLVALWGPDGSQYVGRSMKLYRDEKVAFGGLNVGGIRISEMSHIDNPHTIVLTASRANKKPFTVKPLIISTEESITNSLFKEGWGKAREGLPALEKWWKSIGDANRAILGTEWLVEAKEIASQPLTLEEEVATTCADLSMGTIIESDKLQDLKARVEASGKENLINDVLQSFPPMEL